MAQQLTSTEDTIYKTVDYLVAHPSSKSLAKVIEVENFFWKNSSPKSPNEWLAIVILECNKAFFENSLGKTNQAITSYEQAWHLFQKNKLKNYDIIEYCLKPLGNLYTIIGDYENAENTIKQYWYIAIHESEYKQHQFSAVLNLSAVYQNSGRNDLSIQLLLHTIKTESLTKTQKGIMLNNLGSCYIIENHFEQAKKSITQAVENLKNHPEESIVLSNAYQNLVAIYCKEQDFSQANTYFSQAKNLMLKSRNKSTRTIAKLYLAEAALQVAQQKFNDANKTITTIFKLLIPNYNLKSILPTNEQLYPETILQDALDLQALIYLNQNKPQQALDSYNLSFYIENLFQPILVYENSKIINVSKSRNRTEKCLLIYQSLFIKTHNKLYLERAFQLSEQTKATVLKSYITQTVTPQEKDILQKIQNLNTSIIKEQQKYDLANITLINNAIKDQNQLMLELKAIKKNTFLTPENINIQAVFTKLKQDNATLISYFLGENNLYMFTIHDQEVSFKVIPNGNEQKDLIYHFLHYFKEAKNINNNPIEYNKVANLVYNYLNIPQKNGSKNLLIIPDGILNFLPFEALISQKTQTKNFAKMHYLLQDYTITYNNSASFYLNSKPVKEYAQNVLGVFPIFEKTNLELTFSKNEMEDIQKIFTGKYLQKKEATYHNFKKQAAYYSILHLSTHASSGDIIEPASIKFYDQDVLYNELYNLNSKPSLVVLSACETGIGKLYQGEGAMSIARGFQVSGAQNLLFSLWKVNDYTTSRIMSNFYLNIHRKNNFCKSNQLSKMEFLADESVSNLKKSPYYWAPFVYYGNINNASTHNYWLFMAIICLVIVLLVFVIKKQYYTKKAAPKGQLL